MPITGSQQALMYSNLNILRLGAGRLGYHSPVTYITIAGVAQRVRVASLTITDILNETPSRASMTVDGFTPSKGDAVRVRVGSANGPTLFTGHALAPTQLYDADNKDNVAFHLSCSDETWLLNSRAVTQRYLSMSGTDILIDLITTYAPTFSTAGIVAGLPTLDEITFTNEELPDCISRVMKRLGGYWKQIDRVVYAFITDTLQNPVDLTPGHNFRNFQFTEDLGGVITRVNGEGGGANATVPRVAGDTTIPIEDPAWYAAGGGTVKSGPQIITYTGKQSGGTGSIVAGDQHAPTAPGALTAALVSPKVHGNLTPGVTYLYKVAFANADSETVGGTASGSIVATAVPPAEDCTAVAATIGGGSMGTGTFWYYVITFVTARGETGVLTHTPGYYAWTGALAGANNAVALTNIPTGDGRVIARNIYRSGASPNPAPPHASNYFLVATLNNNTTTTYNDLGGAVTSNPPTVSTATDGEQGALTSIPTSASSTVTKRHLYRSEDGGTTYKRIKTINDNSTTTFTDNVKSGGDDLPSAAQSWAVPEASTTVGVVDLAQFPASGWVRAGSQVIRYTGRSASSGTGTLTGIPASGVGAIVSAIAPRAAVIVEPHLTGIPASGAGSILWPINQGDPVNLYVTRNDATAQTALATLIGGGFDGIREDFIQDRRLSQDEIEARCDALLALKKDARAQVTYECQDVHAVAGATITVNLGAPTNVTGSFKIQQVTIGKFVTTRTSAHLPWRSVVASNEKFSFEDLLRRRRLT